MELEVPDELSFALTFATLTRRLRHYSQKGTSHALREQSRNRSHLVRVYHYAYKSASTCDFSVV